MSSVLFVIFHTADDSVYDIYFTHEECLTAYDDLIRQDHANKHKYYCRAVDMAFMRAQSCMIHASNCTQRASKCTETAR